MVTSIIGRTGGTVVPLLGPNTCFSAQNLLIPSPYLVFNRAVALSFLLPVAVVLRLADIVYDRYVASEES